MTTLNLGRLVDHVHLRVADLAASRRFHRAVLEAVGRLDAFRENDHAFRADERYVDRADGPVSRVHLAFQACGDQQVQAFHPAAVAAGGRDNGGPGLRRVGPSYDAAFVLDPDGNNIEAVWHRPARRPAESAEIDPSR